MSNIWNTKAVNAYLSELSEGNEDLLAHLKTAIGKPLLKDERCVREITERPVDAPDWLDQEKWKTDGPWYEWNIGGNADTDAKHIRDWIKGAMFNEAPWIQNTDDKGRPYTLLNISTMEQAKKCADRAMHELSLKFRDVTEEEGDTKVVKTFDDGFVIVELLTPDALKRESGMMGHCIGDGAHDEYIGTNRRFYSLRDPLNRAHATFDIDHDRDELIECKGKGNATPIKKYRPKTIQFVEEQNLKLAERPGACGFIRIDGNIHDITELPEDLELTPRQYQLLMESDDVVFPRNVVVTGSVDYRLFDGDANARTHPETLEIRGSIVFHHRSEQYPVKPASKSLKVLGNIEFYEAHGITLPEDEIEVSGKADFSNYFKQSLPTKSVFRGDVTFAHSSVSVLPDGIICEGNLTVLSSDITRIPDNAQIRTLDDGHDITLDPVQQIQEIGQNVTASSEILKRIDSKIFEKTRNLTLVGDVVLEREEYVLPEGLHVTGDLDMESISTIPKVPEGLHVGGDWVLDTCTIESDTVPDSFRCDGKITAANDTVIMTVEEFKEKLRDGSLVKAQNENHESRIDDVGYFKKSSTRGRRRLDKSEENMMAQNPLAFPPDDDYDEGQDHTDEFNDAADDEFDYDEDPDLGEDADDLDYRDRDDYDLDQFDYHDDKGPGW